MTTDPVVYHIQDTLTTVHLFFYPSDPIVPSRLRNVLWDVYTFVSSILEISGDGDLPPSRNPYVEQKLGCQILIGSQTGHVLKWSIVRDVLVGLREVMVLQGRAYAARFTIWLEGEGKMGWGIVYGLRVRADEVG